MPRFVKKCYKENKDRKFYSGDEVQKAFANCFDDECTYETERKTSVLTSLPFPVKRTKQEVNEERDPKNKEHGNKRLHHMMKWADEHRGKLKMCLEESDLDFDSGVEMDELDSAFEECSRETRRRRGIIRMMF